MDWHHRLRFRIRTLFRRVDLEQQLDDELQFHLEMQTNANLRLGMPPMAARARAERQFGSVAQHKDEYRDRWGARQAEIVAQDLRIGWRRVRSERGLSFAIVVALALGIGISTAVFSVFHAVLLERLPYAHPERLVRLQAVGAHEHERLFSPSEIRDLRTHARSLDAVAEFHYMYFILLDGGAPQRVSAGVVSVNFLDVLGVAPARGRFFLPHEERAESSNVIVLSDRYWRTRMHGDPHAIGRRVQMNDRTHTIVGILPALPGFPEDADIYMPTAACPMRNSAAADLDREMHIVRGLGRIGPYARPDIAAIRSDLASVSGSLRRAYAGAYDGPRRISLNAVPVRDELTWRFRPTLRVLVASALFLIVNLCASSGALLLASALRRGRQIAMQAALGASRVRLLRQFATQAAIMAATGGVVGLVIAYYSLPALAVLAAHLTVRASEIRFDRWSVFFAAGLVFAISVLLGSVLAFAAVPDPGGGGRAGRGVTMRHPAFRALIVLQVAVSFALLVGAGLTVRSVRNLERVETGYREMQVLTVRLSTDFTKYIAHADRVDLLTRMLAAVRTMPGVESAAISSALPLTKSANVGEVAITTGDRALSPASRQASLQKVSPGYFSTVGVQILDGRDFAGADETRATDVAVINAAMAERYWGDMRAVGHDIHIDGGGPVRVIGVVSNARQRLASAPMDEVYRPSTQIQNAHSDTSLQTRLFVRSRLAPDVLEAALRATLQRVEPRQALDDVRTLDAAREESLEPTRITARLILLFACAGLLISTIGLAGVVAASVSARTQEFGLRTAVGAARRTVLASVLGDGLRLCVSGLMLGLGLALALAQMLTTVLYGVTPYDVTTFAVMAVALIAVALAACALPARRAASVDPNVALRTP